MLTKLTLQNRFYLFILIIFTVKLFLAGILPMTGDEAYFITWANFPDYGYYDHTPMIAWLLNVFLSISSNELWIRLPAIIFSILIAWFIYQSLSDLDNKVAIYAACLYLVIPVNLLPVLMTTDTPLIWWSFFSGASYFKAQQSDSYKWYLACGIFLGLAFLSKFFSGLLALAFLIHTVVLVRRGFKPYIGLVLIFIGLFPFIILNLIWNYNNCWDNYLFNLINRTQGSTFSFKSAGMYFLMLFLIAPPIFYYLLKNINFIGSLRAQNGRFYCYISLFLIPIFLFTLLSFFKNIGLHWLFSFIPFLLLGASKILSEQQLIRSLKFMSIYSMAFVIAISIILLNIPEIFKSNEKLYKTLVIGTYPEKILNKISSYQSDYIFATDSYALSAQLSYHFGKHVIVIGNGSYHGRQDDIVTDFRLLDSKNILILSEVPKLDSFAKFFESFDRFTMSIHGTELYYAVGRNFNYEKYRTSVLAIILERYYKIPNYLPYKSCYMEQRYSISNE